MPFEMLIRAYTGGKRFRDVIPTSALNRPLELSLRHGHKELTYLLMFSGLVILDSRLARIAIESNNFDVVDMLLDSGVFAIYRDDRGEETTLFEAAITSPHDTAPILDKLYEASGCYKKGDRLRLIVERCLMKPCHINNFRYVLRKFLSPTEVNLEYTCNHYITCAYRDVEKVRVLMAYGGKLTRILFNQIIRSDDDTSLTRLLPLMDEIACDDAIVVFTQSNRQNLLILDKLLATIAKRPSVWPNSMVGRSKISEGVMSQLISRGPDVVALLIKHGFVVE